MSYEVDDLGLPPRTANDSAHQLRGRLGHVLQHAEILLDDIEARQRAGEQPTAKQLSAYESRMKEAEELRGAIDRRTEFEAAQRRLTTPEAPTAAGRIEAVRYGGPSLRAFAPTREGEEAAYRAGQWLAATFLSSEPAARYCAAHGMRVDVHAAHSVGVNTAGGALVPDELAREIIRLTETYGVFRQNARVFRLGSDSLSIPRRTGGLSAYFVGENQEGTESDSGWDNVVLNPKKLMALTRMSSEIAEDAIISLADVMAMECAQAFALKEDGCGFIGDGSSAYGGMRGIVWRFENETLAGAIDAASGHDSLSEIDIDDLTSVMGALPEYAEPNAKWYCSKTVWTNVLMGIGLASGGVTISELMTGMGKRFAGYPVVTSPVLTASTAAAAMNGKVIALFGDLPSAAALAARRDLRFGVSDQRYWSSDQIGIKATERFDIVVHGIGSSTTAGPVVALIGNT
jgi:HK97 family phage major capsid protein